MNKEAALAFMKQGQKVTHVHFAPDEWMIIKDGIIHFEDGASCSIEEFYKYRTDESWLTGYRLYNPFIVT